MNKRREFLKFSIGSLTSIGFFISPLFSAARWAYGKTQKTILTMGSARNLEITPLKDFGTMGTSDHKVNLDEWRLEVTGRLRKQLGLTYSEIRDFPSIEKKVVLVCPGVFTNRGLWKGISMKTLLEKAGVEKDVTHVSFSGPRGSYAKVERFPIEDVLTDKVFLAYGVNGETLPIKHGFPLRVVAEGYYGDDWVKYVYKMNLEKR